MSRTRCGERASICPRFGKPDVTESPCVSLLLPQRAPSSEHALEQDRMHSMLNTGLHIT